MEKTKIGAVTDYLYGHVDGECVMITNTIEQIVAFLAENMFKSVKITNVLDLLEIETSMGFIFRCPNQEFLQTELLPHYVPVQRGEVEAEKFVPHVVEVEKEVAVHLHLYFKMKKGETDAEAEARAHAYIEKMTEEEEGADYQIYQTEIREEE